MVMNSLHQWCPVSSVAKSSQTKAIRREGAIILRLKLQKDTDAFRLEREKEATKRVYMVKGNLLGGFKAFVSFNFYLKHCFSFKVDEVYLKFELYNLYIVAI